MFKPLLILFVLLVSQLSFAITREELLAKAQAMSEDEVWKGLTTADASGNTAFGKCRMQIASPGCPSCACPYYFKGWAVVKPGAKDTSGNYGWPKNDYGGGEGASTGCMGGEGAPICWDGSDPATMCTSSLKKNAKAVLINALDNSKHKYGGYTDVCGVAQMPPTKKVSLSLMDSSKLVFVRPSESGNGTVLCGTTKIGDKSGNYESFNPLPSDYCFAAYGVIRSGFASFKQQGKTNVQDSYFISLADYQSKQIDSKVLADAKGILGTLNTKFEGCDLIPYCDYSPTQMSAMKNSEIALYYVALGENKDAIALILRTKIDSLTDAELATARDAYAALVAKLPAENGQTYTLADAIQKVKGNNGTK